MMGGMMFGGYIGFALIIIIIYLLFSLNKDNNLVNKNEKTPLEILDERFAKGEIDEEEYERKKRLLKD